MFIILIRLLLEQYWIHLPNVNTEGRRLVVLGDMLELGENADQMHASLAEKLNAKRFAQVY